MIMFSLAPYSLFLFSFQSARFCDAANILFFWGRSGYSHRITVWPLVERLAATGHNVTFFSPHARKFKSNLNISEITPPHLLRKIGMDFDQFNPAEIRIKGGVKAADEIWLRYFEFGLKLCEFMTTDQETLRWVMTANFDLVIVNGLVNDCGFALAYKWNAPTIVYGTSSLFQWWGESFGLPEENYPEFHFHLPEKMTFFQEVWNTLTPLFWSFYRHWTYFPQLEAMIRPAFHLPNMPPIFQLEQQTSLVFVNTHFSEEYPRSLPPWIVPVGGMHCTDNGESLPEDITQFIEKWSNGFIYFSLGNYIRLPMLPQKQRNAILGAIRKFPDIGIIIKWNGGPVPDQLPANVITSEWIAQQEILAHPQCRAFISHGGLLSTQEAVYHAVPIIVFPIFNDQDFNAQRIHDNERGIKMEIYDLTENKLEQAIRDILTNAKFKNNMKQVSRRFRDRPMPPVETAVWWVEFVLREGNTSFLRPVGVRRTWYEKRMLHIWGFLAFLVTAILARIILLINPQ